jgi:serine/threonine-protein kinase RsbW
VASRDEELFTGSRVLLSLRLSRDPATVTLARDLTGGVLRGLGVAATSVDDVRLVISEACTNAVKYVATADDYQVRMAVDDRRCTIEVLDSGQGFDLRTVSDEMPAPDAPSGRGVALMRYLTDELDVRSDPAHGTSVRMAIELLMEREGDAPSGPADGHVDVALRAEAAYDSKPPKPPR